MIFDVTSSFCASHIYCGIFQIEICISQPTATSPVTFLDVKVKGIKDPTENS